MLIIKNKAFRIAERLMAYALLIVLVINLIVTSIPQSNADTYSKLGTNLALGSPILNISATTEDWNKYETLVWGIYLSNFCMPFVDDYESAFNTNSAHGTKGRGSKSLSFGGGSDVGSSSTIQELLKHAINNQSTAPKRIQVSFSLMENFNILTSCEFDTENISTTASKSPSRPANLKDLFFMTNDYDPNDPTTHMLDNTWSDNDPSGGTSGFSGNKLLSDDGTTSVYNDIRGIKNANLPTFAVSSGNGYNIVFDYRESYDIQLFVAALAESLNSQYASLVNDTLTTSDLSTMPLFLDTYGNICVGIGGRYLVIIPASANQYLKKEQSINLVNSLIFNAGTKSNDKTNIIRNAGQGEFVYGWFSTGRVDTKSGGPAFTNGSNAIADGGIAIFYDTDTIITRKLIESKLLENGFDSTDPCPFISMSNHKSETISIQGPGGNSIVNDNLYINYGEIITELFESRFSDPSNTLPFKLEPVYGVESIASKVDGDASDTTSVAYNVANTLSTVSSLTNTMKSTGNKKRLTNIIDTQSGKDINLFQEEDSIIVSVQSEQGVSGNTKTVWAAYREMPNYVYKCYNGEAGTGDENTDSLLKNAVRSALRYSSSSGLDASTPAGLMDNLFLAEPNKPNSSAVSRLGVEFIKAHPDLYSINVPTNIDSNLSTLTMTSGVSFGGNENSSYLMGLVHCKVGGNDITSKKGKDIITPKFEYPVSTLFRGNVLKSNSKKFNDFNGYELAESIFGRLVKVYQTSDVLAAVSSVLGVRDGTDFSVYAPDIYLAYLDWYGLKKDRKTGEYTCDLNMNILSENAVIDNPDEALGLPSEEDMKKEALQYTYLMLHPESGREYRSEILMSNAESMIYKQYQRIVYGGADTYNYSGVTTRNTTGFLYVNNYSENFLTAWFMKDYPTWAVVIIGASIIFLVLYGLLTTKKFTWFFVSIVMVVNMVLILPSTGELVPYLANRTIQDIFGNKMTYWSISEQASGDAIQDEVFEKYGLDEKESSLAASLVNSKKALYLDRYLTYKQDIANKVSSASLINYDEIQQLRSARWMLPMIMREFTASDGSADYVYVMLGDKLEDLSNLYWYYDPLDAEYSSTINASSANAAEYKSTGLNVTNLNDRKTIFYGYVDTTESNWANNLDLRGTISLAGAEYQSASHTVNEPMVHHFSYLICNSGAPIVSNGGHTISAGYTLANPNSYDNPKVWASSYADVLLNTYKTYTSNSRLSNSYTAMTNKNGVYDRFDRSTIDQSFGYLWYTESPLHYFYQLVKDSFPRDSNIGTLAAELQGKYITASDGEEYRNSFMHDPYTHEVRDILDLEHLFYNTIPYMYTIQLYTGGYNGDGGAFQNAYIDEDSVFAGNTCAWLYRSNWVTKLMENDEYSSPCKIGYYTKSGVRETMTVANQLIPQTYCELDGNNTVTKGRKMVFSRAQQELMGLTDSDLSIVELKCIELNEKIMVDWTLMLNYVGVQDISKEIIMRQMALDATMEFNDTFSPSGISRQSLNMMPTTLDLRAISFDSIMRMLMLNVTKDTSYIFGDTMETIIRNSDIFTSILLWLTALICVYIVPFIRNICLGIMFYIGFIAAIRSLLQDNKAKMKSSLGFYSCHIIVLMLTIAYMLGFQLLMKMTADDEVLTFAASGVEVGNPLWCLLAVAICSLIYCGLMTMMTAFCIKNYKDFGWTAINENLQHIGINMRSRIDKAVSKISADAGVEYEASTASSNKPIADPSNQGKSGRGRGKGKGNSADTSTSQPGTGASSGGSAQTTQTTNGESAYQADDLSYNTSGAVVEDMDAASINKTIEEGKKKTKKANEETKQGEEKVSDKM